MRNYRFTLSLEDNYLEDFGLIEVKNRDLIHQIKNVLRLKPGAPEEISFIDGSGKVLLADFTEINKKTLNFKIKEINQSNKELKTHIKFLVPIIKPENFALMIQKLTELGVQEFQPVVYSRSQKPYLQSFNKQKSKLNTIIQEATEQCEGALFAKLNDPMNFSDFSGFGTNSLKLFAYENLAGDKTEKEFFSKLKIPEQVILTVGPEGGLTEVEVKILELNGFTACSLGKRLLKAETASISLVSRLLLD